MVNTVQSFLNSQWLWWTGVILLNALLRVVPDLLPFGSYLSLTSVVPQMLLSFWSGRSLLYLNTLSSKSCFNNVFIFFIFIFKWLQRFLSSMMNCLLTSGARSVKSNTLRSCLVKDLFLILAWPWLLPGSDRYWHMLQDGLWDVLHFLLSVTWAIWLTVFQSQDLHLDLVMSLWGKMVPPTMHTVFKTNSTNLSDCGSVTMSIHCILSPAVIISNLSFHISGDQLHIMLWHFVECMFPLLAPVTLVFFLCLVSGSAALQDGRFEVSRGKPSSDYSITNGFLLYKRFGFHLRH